MNLQKETKLRTDLEAEKKANLELIAKLKTENQNGLEINEKVNLELEQEKRITERLKTEVDGWKDEANIYHNKLTSKFSTFVQHTDHLKIWDLGFFLAFFPHSTYSEINFPDPIAWYPVGLIHYFVVREF